MFHISMNNFHIGSMRGYPVTYVLHNQSKVVQALEPAEKSVGVVPCDPLEWGSA